MKLKNNLIKKGLKIAIFAILSIPPSIGVSFGQIDRTDPLPRLNFPIAQNGLPKINGWAGGLNAPQWSEADLNNDNRLDLVVFDRVGDKILTFLKNTAGNYVFAPEFATSFPKGLTDFALLRDFNNDRAADIFTFNNDGVAGIRVFKGRFVNNKLEFSLIRFQVPIGSIPRDILTYRFYTGRMVNLYVNSTDIPAFDDIDGDGDLDILAFNTGGGNIQHFANRSVERGFGRDTLIYELADDCWGRCYDNGAAITVSLSPRLDSCVQRFRSDKPNPVERAEHPGSSLCTFDQNGDGDKDLLLGSVSFDQLNHLTNGGSRATAFMTAQDINFPANSERVNLFRFPAAYYMDYDNDGKKDLMVSPNLINFCENQRVGWFYKNISTTNEHIFDLQQKDFLVDGMLDFGNGANPAVADIDADGDLDIVVGNHARFLTGNRRDASLHLLRNLGTPTQPNFVLESLDWLNLRQFSTEDVFNFAPNFGDLDNDGDLDLVVGEETGTLFYLQNTGGVGRPMQFAAPIPNYKNIVSNAAKPQIIDLDRDGLKDIVIGRLNGRLEFYRNIGTATVPNFAPAPTRENVGGVYTYPDTAFASGVGSCAPFFLDLPNNQRFLVAGSELGGLMIYDSIQNVFSNWRLRTPQYRGLLEGVRTSPTLADLNGDGRLDLIVGNLRGGLSVFSSDFNVDGRVSVQNPVNLAEDITIFPNPVSDILTIKNLNFEQKWTAEIVNSLGQIVQKINFLTDEFIDVSGLQSGFYVLNLRNNLDFKVKNAKFLKQ